MYTAVHRRVGSRVRVDSESWRDSGILANVGTARTELVAREKEEQTREARAMAREGGVSRRPSVTAMVTYDDPTFRVQ